jgi:hypothetical protein
MGPPPSGYPVRVEIDYPERLSRLLIFVKWLLALPHYIVLILYLIAIWVGAIVAFFAILFTGNVPRGLWDFIFGYNRWALRVWAYVGLLRDEYPPFSNGPEDYPARLDCEYPERLSRGLIFIKWLLIIPHWIVLIFYALAVIVVSIIAWFAILFTGSYPRGLFDFVVGYVRWNTRVNVYCGQFSGYNPYVGGLLRDEYPPFSNEP